VINFGSLSNQLQQRGWETLEKMAVARLSNSKNRKLPMPRVAPKNFKTKIL
jgi:hypothetical protein